MRMSSESKKAAFISYASEDRAAALHICEALRRAGIEVWFDQSELRGGDAWDALIRKQIKTCDLFIALVSQNTHAREEGYFRLEWKLAVDRSHLMTQRRAFLLPVAIDSSGDHDAHVPDRFREIQWARLLHGDAPDALVELVKGILKGENREARGTVTARPAASPLMPNQRLRRPIIWVGIVAVLAATLAAGLAFHRRHSLVAVQQPEVSVPSGLEFKPPEHSIAVLPFANMSGDSSQEYFSDGLSEELRDSLSRLQGLQVAARTSAFYFKNKSNSAAEIARKLDVGALLQGSVRRQGTKVRISVQLINAVTGFELWSQTYDRELKDILKLQVEIASTVTRSLRVKLVGEWSKAIEAGGTQNPDALDMFLKAMQVSLKSDKDSTLESIALLSKAMQLDPAFADAYQMRADQELHMAIGFDAQENLGKRLAEARSDIEHAIRLAPQRGRYFSSYAIILAQSTDYRSARQQFIKAQELAPNDASVVVVAAGFRALMGDSDAAASMVARGIQLDPLSSGAYLAAAGALYSAGRYVQALEAADHALSLGEEEAAAFRCQALLMLGKIEETLSACTPPNHYLQQVSLAVLLHRLNREGEAQAMFDRLKRENGDAAALQYAEVFAQWGDRSQALLWFEKAHELHDPGLIGIKVDPLLDPIRQEPRFQTILRSLNFPD
jgi:TolB-like protein/tetratricopeptide (TPR) repeat protein